jgi:hypothetical protein
MGQFTWDDDTITGDGLIDGSAQQQINPGTGIITVTAGSASGWTINPFETVSVNAGANNQVRLRVAFTNNTSNTGTQLEQMFTWNGTAMAAAPTQGAGFLTFTGTGAELETWLRTMAIVGTSTSNDAFQISLRGMDETSTTLQGLTKNILIYTVACFMEGTLIRTPAGERPVEALRRGDMVVTADGTAKAVKWIGHRSYEAEFGAAEAFVRPVVFKAGSLGGGLPVRDLKVSPQHGMLVDGVMVPAAALVNGVSILRDANPGDVTYFHIELDGHEAVFAEGALTETFVDHDSRAMFDNADEFGMLFGTAAARPVEQPRLEEGFRLAAIRRRLAEVAGIPAGPAAGGPATGNLERIEDGVLHGWIVDTACAEAVEAEVLVDGEVVGRVVANRYRADLDQAGLAGGRGGFTFALPASAERLEQVSLRRVIDGQVLAAAVAVEA